MVSSIEKSRTTTCLLCSASIVAAVVVGIFAVCAPNLIKPVFLARYLSEEEVYAASSARVFFGVLVGYDVRGVFIGIKDVVLTASEEHPYYAIRHGVSPDQSWTLHATFVSDDGNVTLGELWVQWDGFMHEMSVYGSKPYSKLYPHYEAIITRRAAMTFKNDWENQDFVAASDHFPEFTENGDLVWWQEN